MPSHSAAERAALADALEAAGPIHATLCDGWTTTELAAHLVAREHRPLSAVGVVIPALAGWADRARGRYRDRPYADLVELVRSGPPRTSPMAIPGVDARVNLVEHFVHCEDVRRAGPGWVPRELPTDRQDALWAALRLTGRLNLRRSPVSVTLRTPDGRTLPVVTRSGTEGVAVVGTPGELTLYISGRKDQAQVQLEGPDAAVATFRALMLRI
jgi:uncharacterized protein (TIGR03085 family)